MNRVFRPLNQNLLHTPHTAAPNQTVYFPLGSSTAAGSIYSDGVDRNASRLKTKSVKETPVSGVELQLSQGFGARCIDVEPRMYASIACTTKPEPCANLLFV